MATAVNRKKAARKQAGKARKSSSIQKGKKEPAPSSAGLLRQRLRLTQPELARLLSLSVRSLATLEQGAPASAPVARKLTELQRLTAALSEVVKKEALGKWLQTVNPVFDGLKPLEVIERGESDRLWEMIYFLRSGVPS